MGGWSLNGTVFKKGGINKEVPPHIVATKVVPKTSKPPKASVNTRELIEAIKTSLSSTVFKRGKTYKELAAKHNVKEAFVFKINKGHIT